jgi:hypothetical protein
LDIQGSFRTPCALNTTRRIDMTTTSLDTTHETDLDEFLPLAASAWKEGGLTDLELAAVCLEIIRNPDLDLSCRETLQAWLDAPD